MRDQIKQEIKAEFVTYVDPLRESVAMLKNLLPVCDLTMETDDDVPDSQAEEQMQNELLHNENIIAVVFAFTLVN